MAAIRRNETMIFGRRAIRTMTALPSRLEIRDRVPQFRVLFLVGGPDLLLRDLAEGWDVSLDYRHALGFQLAFGRGEIVDRLGQVADLGLRLAAGVEHQLLVLRAEAFPDAEVHGVERGPVVVE